MNERPNRQAKTASIVATRKLSITTQRPKDIAKYVAFDSEFVANACSLYEDLLLNGDILQHWGDYYVGVHGDTIEVEGNSKPMMYSLEVLSSVDAIGMRLLPHMFPECICTTCGIPGTPLWHSHVHLCNLI